MLNEENTYIGTEGIRFVNWESRHKILVKHAQI